VQPRYRIEIERQTNGRLFIRVRPPYGPERIFTSLEALYRYLVERLRQPGPPLG